MITIQKSSELNGAQKFGQCINCGVNSKDADIYKIMFQLSDLDDNENSRSTINICYKCMKKLNKQMREVIIEKEYGNCSF